MLNQVIVRRRGKDVCFLNVVESHQGEPVIDHVEFLQEPDGSWRICVTEQDGRKRIFDMSI